MSWLRKVLGGAPTPIPDISSAGGGYGQEVVGESFHQPTLRRIAAEGDEFVAHLVREPKHEHDRNAIAVVHPRLGAVGYIPRDVAAECAAGLDQLGGRAACRATLAGGHHDPPNYGVWLGCDLRLLGASPIVDVSRNSTSTPERAPEDAARSARYTRFASECMDNPLRNRRIVITGVLVHWEREQCERMLERLGARTTGTVSGRTTLVIVGDGPGAKLEKAREKGVATMTEMEFIEQVLEPAYLLWKAQN